MICFSCKANQPEGYLKSTCYWCGGLCGTVAAEGETFYGLDHAEGEDWTTLQAKAPTGKALLETLKETAEKLRRRELPPVRWTARLDNYGIWQLEEGPYVDDGAIPFADIAGAPGQPINPVPYTEADEERVKKLVREASVVHPACDDCAESLFGACDRHRWRDGEG